jgi:hypothetical protein
MPAITFAPGFVEGGGREGGPIKYVLYFPENVKTTVQYHPRARGDRKLLPFFRKGKTFPKFIEKGPRLFSQKERTNIFQFPLIPLARGCVQYVGKRQKEREELK